LHPTSAWPAGATLANAPLVVQMNKTARKARKTRLRDLKYDSV
jgi:hypothetical protein